MSQRTTIWGWYWFDWACQPFFTLLLTFIFAPFFAQVATEYYASGGLSEQSADARAQTLWSTGITIAGLIIAFSAPVLGAIADSSGAADAMDFLFHRCSNFWGRRNVAYGSRGIQPSDNVGSLCDLLHWR